VLDLSIILVSYNTRDLLLQCIDFVIGSLERAAQGGRFSLDARSISRGYEIIVVDNASDDGSAAAMRRYFPGVHIIQNEFNRGFAAANNQAIEMSQGRHLLFLNPDTQVSESAIPELVRFLDRHPRAGVVTGKLLNLDGSMQHSGFHFPTLWMAFLDFFPLSYRLTNSSLNGRYSAWSYRAPFEIDHPLGACMLVRREVIERVGAFSEDYFMYCEEIDWCIRIKRDRWRIFCQPRAEIMHLGGQSTHQDAERMFVELFRARLTLFRKYYSPFYRVAVKLIIALGLWWEYSLWFQRYLRGEVPKQQYAARQQACRQVFSLLWHHG